jgi:2-polyprenyl-3-methyl-5-hydroxy-6-metoxy-1,4-benzoquinol methylase
MSDQNASPLFTRPLSACPLCGGGHIRPRYQITRYNPPFNVDRCGGCGFMFMNPRLMRAVSGEVYNEDYYRGKAEYSYFDERESEKYSRYVWDQRIKVIRRYADSGNFLDVGSSFGGFLKAASSYFRPHGIEISSYAGDYSKKSVAGPIHIGTLEDHPFTLNFFSVITMIELLEHLPDPFRALRECHRLLTDKGLLVIQTANMDGLQAKLRGDTYAYFMPGHLSYFSRSNLCALLSCIGFSKIKVFYPVEFGLIPKLKKSRQAFTSAWDYWRWLRIAAYHYIGMLHCGNFAATSSMVIYAIK